MNLQDREVELNFREVTCKRSVSGDDFGRGIQDFDFSVSGKNAFIPSLSYFVIDVSLRIRPSIGVRISQGDILNTPVVGVSPTTYSQGQTIPTGSYRMPVLSDGIALADHFGSTLYNNCYFRAGNSDVSLIQQFIPQAGVIKSRLDKSFAWSKSIGRSLSQDDADFTRRRNYVSFDGKFHDDGLKNTVYNSLSPIAPIVGGAVSVPRVLSTIGLPCQYSTTAGRVLYTVTAGPPAARRLRLNYPVAGLVGATMFNPVVSGMNVGSIFKLTDTTTPTDYYFQIVEGASTTASLKAGNTLNATYTDILADTFLTFDVSPVLSTVGGSDLAADAALSVTDCWVQADPSCGYPNTQVVFQPPIGIFSEANPISGGDFKIALNPSPAFQTNGVQSLTGLRQVLSDGDPNDYDLFIGNVKFYVCTIKSDVSPTGVIPLSLIEMAVLNKSMNNGSSSQNLDFTVPPSTLAITVFVQGGNAGTTTVCPSTKFYMQQTPGVQTRSVQGFDSILYDNVANDLQSIQVTYGSVTKTQTLYSSQYNEANGINANIQRFLQTMQYSGKIVSEGGAESDPQYLERGNMWHFDFSKDKSDTSSYVNVQINFNRPVPAGNTLFIVAHYSRQCEISYENGFVTQVVSVNR